MKIANRSSGVLLHVTSLPSDYGIGDLGPCSYRFVDLLAEAKQHYWSILPLTPTSIKYGSSPYQPQSAFAGNTLLISPEQLLGDGLLTEQNAEALKLPPGQVNFRDVEAKKKTMLRKAHHNLLRKRKRIASEIYCDFRKFCLTNSNWLEEYALFKAIREATNKPWFEWTPELRDRDPSALEQKQSELKDMIDLEKFAQFLFARQWNRLKQFCRTKKVAIFGDMPFYMSYDSADVWSNSELFKLDDQKKPLFVGGVPPDYFSKNGQLWGNPIYNWVEMKKTGFRWWMERIRMALALCDLIRLDHFRGFTAYWQIPAASKTAKMGKWINAPSKVLFGALKESFPDLPFVAEDLGMITKAVRDNLARLELPGVRVLLFAFGGSEDNPNLPGNYPENSIVYTGTHDTNTVNGWFAEEATDKMKERVFHYIGRSVSKRQVSLEFVKMALSSRSILSIIPMQDILSLGSEARMNNPAISDHNWEWRMESGQLSKETLEKMAEFTKNSKRSST